MTDRIEILAQQGAKLSVTLNLSAGPSLIGRALRMQVRKFVGDTVVQLVASSTDERLLVTGDRQMQLEVPSDVMAALLVSDVVELWTYDAYSYTNDPDAIREAEGVFRVSRANTRDTEIEPAPTVAGFVSATIPQAWTAEQQQIGRINLGILEGGGGGGGEGVSDHGELDGLADDDHTQYHNDARGDARYALISAPADAVTAHAAATDPHPGYLQNIASGVDGGIAEWEAGGTGLRRSFLTILTLLDSAWDRFNHTGTQLAATIIDFSATASAAAPVQSVAGRTGAVVIAVADVSGAESTANKAQPSGYASLDSDGKIPQAQLPAIAITEYLGSVASQSAMLALSGQKGDWCTRSDSPGTWIISGTDPTLLGSWTQIVHPTDAVTSVAGRTGAVTLSATDITDSTATGRSIVTAADAAAVRTAAALGGAATLNVGTTAGTVAAGDDSRLSDARTPTAHNHAASEITSGTLDAARLPTPTTTALGGVKRNTGSAGQYVTGIDTDGSLLRDTPAGGAASNIKDILAGELIPRVTSGGGIDGEELATNRVNLDYIAFDPATIEFAQYGCPWPGAYTTFTATFYWTGASGSGSVRLRASAVCFADDAAMDAAQGTLQAVTDTYLAAADAHKSAATAAITPAGTVANGNWTVFEFSRDPTHGDDNYSVDCRVKGIRLEFA